MSGFGRGAVDAVYRFRWIMTIKYFRAPVAESVDALDLKSNRGSPSVPVQVWPRAFFKRFFGASFLLFDLVQRIAPFHFLFSSGIALLTIYCHCEGFARGNPRNNFQLTKFSYFSMKLFIPMYRTLVPNR